MTLGNLTRRRAMAAGLPVACGLSEATGALVVATVLVTAGAVLASRDQWRR